MVRDEVDIVERVVINLLTQGVERVVLADNLSGDGTTEILERLSASHPVTVVRDGLVAYYQAEKMTLLANAAAEAGARWVIPFDADEMWVSPTGSLPGWLDASGVDVVQVPVFNHVPTVHDDMGETDPVRRLRWRKSEPNQLHKVAFRAHPRARLHQGSHGVTRRGRRGRGLEIRHFPYRSEEQFVRKFRQGAAALAATDFTPDRGRVWRGIGTLDAEAQRAAWRALVEKGNLPLDWPEMPRTGIVEDPAPIPEFGDSR